MQFNPDKNKQAVQVIFSQIKEAIAHPPMFFNGSEIVVKTEHKHLGMILDSKLSFQSHVGEAIIKARKGIEIIRFLSKYVSRDVLDQIFKLLEELGWEILHYRGWYRRLCHFYKLQNNQRPSYLYSEIPQERTFHHDLRRANV